MSFIPIPVTRSFYLDCADFICRSPLRGLSGTVAVEIGSSQAATAVCSLPPCGGGLGRGGRGCLTEMRPPTPAPTPNPSPAGCGLARFRQLDLTNPGKPGLVGEGSTPNAWQP